MLEELTHLRGVKQIVAIILQSFIKGEYVQDTTNSWQFLIQGHGNDFRVKNLTSQNPTTGSKLL